MLVLKSRHACEGRKVDGVEGLGTCRWTVGQILRRLNSVARGIERRSGRGGEIDDSPIEEVQHGHMRGLKSSRVR
jgi:hypothetical protein